MGLETLDQFAFRARADVFRFVEDWRANQAEDPTNWPANMSAAEWDEQFRVFLDV